MLKTRAAALAASLLAAAGLTAAPATGKKYDLRGPAPKQGQSVVKKSASEIKDARMSVSVGGMDIDGSMSMKATEDLTAKFVKVQNGDVTQVSVKVGTGKVDQTINMLGNRQQMSQNSPLAGETVFCRKKGGTWKCLLEDATPSEEQKRSLDNMTPYVNDRALFPKKEYAVGDTWKLDDAGLKAMLSRVGGKTFTSGKGTATFKEVKTVNGQECAVIEVKFSVKGTAVLAGDTLKLKFEGKADMARSLKTGVFAKAKYAGTMSMEGKVQPPGAPGPVDFALEGKIVSDETETVK